MIEDKYDEEEYVVENGKDVTRKYITVPRAGKSESKRRLERKNIFIVHGRDYKPVKELKGIRGLGLNPIVLHEQPSGSRTIVEKLEKYSDVGYAFVILTPDDLGGPFLGKVRGLGANKLEGFHPRARQNVILEFGYFIGRLGRDKVCCLHTGDVELPSDMHGIVYVPFKNSVEEVRQQISEELRAAGYQIKSQKNGKNS
ncbi:MAG: TIR domain-containing protein [Candidatus Bathyarchaeia archaeon]|nr:nucleotide-binding protein [Candidatus Bathyarchaeota archaeon A05DMB-4]MDH7595398.1 nucleotide-binding protein [Candidatus Bathyarchaeota archaeon]